CQADLCPDTATCVLFHPEVQGCGYTDRNPSRTGRQFCLQRCQADSDCRTESGYICADPRESPWNAIILDRDQGQQTGIVGPDNGVVGGDVDASTDDAAVCQVNGPVVPGIDAGVTYFPDASTPAIDASDDAGDAGASDAGIEDAADSGG